MLIPLNNILLFLQKKKHNILLKWIADTKKKIPFPMEGNGLLL